MMTHMCIDSTTRASKELGYQPILISDATATKALTFEAHEIPAEAVQRAFLSALETFSTVMKTDDYLNGLEKNCVFTNKGKGSFALSGS